MLSDSLSNIELYYSTPEQFSYEEIKISGEEVQHIIQVMRHKTGDILHVTNGEGKIFESKIEHLSKQEVNCRIINSFNYENKFSNYTFCITKLKSPDRFEFALEKLVELGITNIIVYDSIRSASKGNKPERWNKILVSAMKQSLRAYLPSITILNNLNEIINFDGVKIMFEQNSNKLFSNFIPNGQEKYYFIFGPEGGLTESELQLVPPDNIYNLNSKRLRSETAIVLAASILTTE